MGGGSRTPPVSPPPPWGCPCAARPSASVTISGNRPDDLAAHDLRPTGERQRAGRSRRKWQPLVFAPWRVPVSVRVRAQSATGRADLRRTATGRKVCRSANGQQAARSRRKVCRVCECVRVRSRSRSATGRDDQQRAAPISGNGERQRAGRSRRNGQPLVFAPWRVPVSVRVRARSATGRADLRRTATGRKVCRVCECVRVRSRSRSATGRARSPATANGNGPHDLAGRGNRSYSRRGAFLCPFASAPDQQRAAHDLRQRATATGRTISPEGLPRPSVSGTISGNGRTATGRTISPQRKTPILYPFWIVNCQHFAKYPVFIGIPRSIRESDTRFFKRQQATAPRPSVFPMEHLHNRAAPISPRRSANGNGPHDLRQRATGRTISPRQSPATANGQRQRAARSRRKWQPLVFAPWRVCVSGAVSFPSGAFLALLCRLWRGLCLSAPDDLAAPVSVFASVCVRHDLRPTGERQQAAPISGNGQQANGPHDLAAPVSVSVSVCVRHDLAAPVSVSASVCVRACPRSRSATGRADLRQRATGERAARSRRKWQPLVFAPWRVCVSGTISGQRETATGRTISPRP